MTLAELEAHGLDTYPLTFDEIEAQFKALPDGIWHCPWLHGPALRHYFVAMDNKVAAHYQEFWDQASMDAAFKGCLSALQTRHQQPLLQVI